MPPRANGTNGRIGYVRSLLIRCYCANRLQPSDAAPHHLIFVADPQLVDPHTYPGRPWPLSSFTIRHTDQYLRRGFTFAQNLLRPQSVLFLGDLFDGGREWSTRSYKSPEKRWHKYGDSFWLKEYARFGKIFLDPWVKRVAEDGPGSKRRLLGSLPGNHDLGFSNGITLPVRNRFSTFFGESNRVDIIGNHSFVSVDTVSLSARSHQEQGPDNKAIWEPASKFLSVSKEKKAQALERELNSLFTRPENQLSKHAVTEIGELKAQPQQEPIPEANSDMPTILLTHVPLFRAPATPCGPFREHWPPSALGPGAAPLEKDERNAIKIHGGYQYQNVLDEAISKDLVDKIGNVEHVFSGDDHDYCELVHKNYPSQGEGVREITVKSISWAMGVRRPGFLLVSLWNPIDRHGNSLPMSTKSTDISAPATIQSYLCLLPDQLAIFVRYLFLLIVTIVALAFDALLTSSASSKSKQEAQEPLLPVSNSNGPRVVKSRTRADSTSFSTSKKSDGMSQLASRSTNSRAMSSSPTQYQHYSIPMASEREVDAIMKYQKNMELSNGNHAVGKHSRGYSRSAPLTKTQTFLRHLRTSFLRVASIGLLWYTWLAFTI